MNSLFLRITFCWFLSLAAVAAQAADWAHKQKITLDATAAAGNLAQGATSVPIAVRLHSGNFTFADAKPDGSDIRFMSADGKLPLKFHIEQYDAANELAVAWVLVPKITPNAKTDSFLMEWGNPGAPPTADAKGTYDASQIFVLHYSDKEGVRAPQDAKLRVSPIWRSTLAMTRAEISENRTEAESRAALVLE